MVTAKKYSSKNLLCFANLIMFCTGRFDRSYPDGDNLLVILFSSDTQKYGKCKSLSFCKVSLFLLCILWRFRIVLTCKFLTSALCRYISDFSHIFLIHLWKKYSFLQNVSAVSEALSRCDYFELLCIFWVMFLRKAQWRIALCTWVECDGPLNIKCKWDFTLQNFVAHHIQDVF